MNAHLEPDHAGDWLFQHNGMLYGPVPARDLLAKVEAGAIPASTPVARDGEPFRPIGEEPQFAVQVARATARLRVEAHAREQAQARRRRRITIAVTFSVAAVLLAVGAVRLVLWAEDEGLFKPDEEAMAALQIQVSLPTFRLEPVAAREGEELHEYLEEEPAPRGKKRAVAKSAGKRSGAKATTAQTDPDGLATHAAYDQGTIQTVLAREQRSLYPCLQQQAKSDPTFRGEVPLSFTIDNSGRVGRVWIDRPGLESGPLFTCFRDRMAAWRFPAFQGERPSVSLSFRVGS